jgi:hypothetical protein
MSTLNLLLSIALIAPAVFNAQSLDYMDSNTNRNPNNLGSPTNLGINYQNNYNTLNPLNPLDPQNGNANSQYPPPINGPPYNRPPPIPPFPVSLGIFSLNHEHPLNSLPGLRYPIWVDWNESRVFAGFFGEDSTVFG